MENIFGKTATEIAALLTPLEVPSYRAKQIVQWLYKRGATDFMMMDNLPLSLRRELAALFTIDAADVAAQSVSPDGLTAKLLFAFPDGETAETVLMRQPYGASVCVSTQVGCAMGCAFCASTIAGFRRNLSAGEVLSQVLGVGKLLPAGEKVNTIVIMGSGEPLMNYDQVLSFVRLMHEPYTLGLGYRNITLSTSGITPEIYRLAEENLPINLAISLHAPHDGLRSELMPVNKKYPLEGLIAAGGFYGERTKRRVTYEYILLGNVNDSEADARALAKLLRGQLANVNLIPFNPVTERSFHRSTAKKIKAFRQIIDAHHIPVTIRREMGATIDAACGQLRNRHLT